MRLAAQMAAEYINGNGGIKSMGGARIELVYGDTQSNADVAKTEAERLVNSGVVMLQGAFHSGHTAAIVPIAQQRQIPLMIDLGSSAAITANVAQSVREGKQKLQYVYRVCPSSNVYAASTVKHMAELFADAGVSVKRCAMLLSNDLLAQSTGTRLKTEIAKANAGFSIVDSIDYPENAVDLSTEISRIKAMKPDVIIPIVRPATASIMLQELYRQRVDYMGIIASASSGLYEPYQINALKNLIEFVMNDLPWPNFRRPRMDQISAEYSKRANGLAFDLNSGFAYETQLVIADVLERAKTTDPVGLVEAIKKTEFHGSISINNGPIRFDENGDNAAGGTAMLQILRGKTQVVWPKDAAETEYVFPSTKQRRP